MSIQPEIQALKLEDQDFETRAIHVGQDPDKWYSKPVVPPIVLASTFKRDEFGAGPPTGYIYSRCENPTRDCLEECLASLENAKYALTYGSGVAAVANLSFLLKTGDHVLASDDVYSGTYLYFTECASRMGIEISFIDMVDLANVEASIKPNTAMIWIETPSNPTLKLVDIKAVCELARKRLPNAYLVADNTFASPYFQNPLDLGVDVVMHSLTKYLNGHSDVIMGAIMVSNEELYQQLKKYQRIIGAIADPFSSYLVNRGLRTLSVRMERHQENGLKVARALEKDPRIERVVYPGLESHPQHELYKRQMKGFGGMVSVYLKTDQSGTFKFLKSLKIFTASVSLGGFESLVQHPNTMTHALVAPELKQRAGITDNLLRISVGLEKAEDLVNDLYQALDKSIAPL